MGDDALSLTIGVLARTTGIPAETLRTWERRYGFPEPTRTDGGQRIYPAEVVPRLALVSRALEAGHRPRQVLPLDEAGLRALLGLSGAAAVPPGPSHAPSLGGLPPLDAVRALDGRALELTFHREVARTGLLPFLDGFASEFLDAVGRGWACGEVTVYQEHYASERLQEFLREHWRPLADLNRGPGAVLAAPPDEHHALGLHLVACALALAGLRVHYLGANTPWREVSLAAVQTGARLVAVSASEVADREKVRAGIVELRVALPRSLHLVAGGKGAPRGLDGVGRFERLGALHDWASSL